MDKKDILEKLFSGDKQLPSIPSLYSELKKLTQNPFTSNKKISDLIIKDLSMVTKILRLSNSALYAKSHEIKSLANAITYLGTETLEKMILEISLVKMFDSKDNEIPEFDISIFWEHSLSTACFSKLISEKLKLPDNENYYLGGLLHDIGKLAIYHFYPKLFNNIVKLQLKGVVDIDAENEILGVDHTEIGTYLAEKWNFDKDIVDSIRLHHKEDSSMGFTPALIKISNLFSKAAGMCFPWDDVVFSIVDDPAWKIITANMKNKVDVERLTFEVTEEAETIRKTVKDLLSIK